MAEQGKSNFEAAMGWLGRQVGHVVRAARRPVSPRVVYRRERVEEAPLPGTPGVTLRRTTTDEVILQSRDSSDCRGEVRD